MGASRVSDAGQGSTIGDYRRALNYAAGNNVRPGFIHSQATIGNIAHAAMGIGFYR